MKITPPADDYGLQRLKQSDSHREVKATEKVAPYPRIAPSEEHHEPRVMPERERRARERRQQERRQKKSSTTLDTRLSHERRHHERRTEPDTSTENGGEEQREESGTRGIDDFA
ncbi:MAG: hypothetical protein OQL08_06760 [Gammaproteobacteria bacterium]|nr:hypothetical protein [Gammaproteobacteria bacterium]